MELNFGEKIKQLRRSRDLTQETLADALGISAQSVSKWECAYGYPDITQLPAIANFFGVTIDELLDNDKYSKEMVFESFREHLKDMHEATEEKVELILEHHRRYPDVPMYGYMLCANIADHITKVCPDNRDKYYPILLQQAEKYLNSPYHDVIVGAMIKACPEEEVEEWLKHVAYSPKSTRRNHLIDRYSARGDTRMCQIQIYLGNLEAIAIQLGRRYPNNAGAEAKGAYHKAIVDTLATFGKDGKIPDGWLAFAACNELVYAGCLFDAGKKDKGKTAFLSAVEKIRDYQNLTEEYLDLGSLIFGGIRVNRNWHFAMDRNGTEHHMYGTALLMSFGSAAYILKVLSKPWFDSVRHEDYYREVTEWLKGLAEQTSG